MFGVTKTYNIEYQQAKPYGSLFTIPYNLDIYEPTSDTLAYRPLVVFLFGGGYLIGDKLNPPANDYCTDWAERGFVCVSVNYRIGFNTLISASAERAVYRSVQDLQASLRFLAENRNLYGIDTANIIISGNSAGAITSVHSAFMEQSQAPISYQGVGFGLDSDDLGDVYSSGNTDWNNVEVLTHGLIANWGGILDTALIGDAPDDNIPTILFHGDQDNLVNYNSGHPFGYPLFPIIYGSVPMSSAFASSNIPFYFETFEGAGHEPELTNSAYLDTILMKSNAFMYEEVLKPNVISVAGNTNSATTLTESYIITANENIIVSCVNVSNGTVLNNNTNQFDILWNSIGLDTIEIVVFNNILAKDTFLLPVNISDICTFSPLSSTNNNTICNSNSIIINGTIYNAANPSGTEIFSNIGPNNCDSTVTVSLNVLPLKTGSETSTICINDSITVNGTIYNAANPSGTEIFGNIGPYNCDSIVTISLNVLPAIDISTTLSGVTLISNQSGATYQWMNCNNNYAPIAGETNQNFTAKTSGNYAVEVTQNNCTDTSDCESITVVGLKENKKSELLLYPNPTTGILTIEGVEGIVTVYDIYGRLLLTANTNTLELSNAGMGIYFIRVVDEQGKLHSVKLLKN